MKKILWMIIFFPAITQAASSNNDNRLDQLMSKWLSLESQKGSLQSEWNGRKAELQNRLELLSIEESSLKKVIDQASQNKNNVDSQRLSLIETQNALEKDQATLSASLNKVTGLVRSLKGRLPPPLQVEWEKKLPVLARADASNSEKLECLLSLLKMLEDFNGRVAMNRSSIKVPEADGASQALVTEIFLGVSQGWYVSDDGRYYGYGRATKLGWQWWHGASAATELGQDLRAKDILDVKSILENPTKARFVSLPVKII